MITRAISFDAIEPDPEPALPVAQAAAPRPRRRAPRVETVHQWMTTGPIYTTGPQTPVSYHGNPFSTDED